MGNILFLHAIGLTPYATDTCDQEGLSAFSRITAKMFQLPEVERAVLFTDLPADKLQKHWLSEWGPLISRTDWTVDLLFQQLKDESDGYEHLFYVWADAPLLDLALAEKMYRNHRRFFADYTFADGYPLGLTPQILKPGALAQLIELSQRHTIEVQRDYIFEILQKDINAFDLETEVAPEDQRMLRVLLAADTRRNSLQLHRIMEAGGRDAPTVQAVLKEKPEILRTLPAYINTQITGGCPQACSYCPYPQIGGDILNRRDEMPLEKWKSLLGSVHEYCDDAMMGISLWGEPSLHSKIDDVITAVLDYPGLSLTVETSGVGWSVPVLERVADTYKAKSGGDPSRLAWIVSLDSDEKELYEKLRGPQLEEALSAIQLLGRLFPDQVYVQAVRMKDSEDQLDQFFRRWNDREGIEVIIQKYDSFCGVLPERKVTDLSPIERFPCWHLKRDMAVLMDGTVTICREDLENKYILGNIFEESLKDVWERGDAYYRQHLNGEYPQLCRDCDEYYTYNF